MSKYNSDSPISNPNEDKFRRSDYAEKIARALRNLDQDRSYVVALYAKWGAGKTSVLNMVENYLEKENVIILKLEPWGYITSRDLAANLLSQIINKLSEESENSPKNGSDDKRRIIERAKNWCKIRWYRHFPKAQRGLVEAAREANDIGVQAISAILAGVSSWCHSYGELRNEIERELEAHEKKIVVVIDDIDRLEPQEMLNTFKLIRSVANIKGVTYLLAFDEEIVSTAISDTLPHKEGGRDYVDKIVQIPIELPTIEDDELREQLQSGIMDILKDSQIGISQTELTEIESFSYEIMPQLSTPRTVVRCLNALRFVVPLLAGETNISDTVRIEILRIVAPELYRKIRDNKQILTTDMSHCNQDQFQSLQEQLGKIYNDDLGIIHFLFPNTINNYRSYHGQYNEAQSRRQKRICSAAYFNRYFMYSISKSDVSDSEVIDILEQNTNQSGLDRLFEEHAYYKIIEKIRDNIDIIRNPEKFCVQLVLTAEKIMQPTSESVVRGEQIEIALRIVDEIVTSREIDSQRALRIYKDIVRKSGSLNTITYSIRLVTARFEHGQKDRQILSQADYAEYEKFVLEKLGAKMADGELPTNLVNSISRQLYAYIQKFSGSTDKINAYMRKKVKTPSQALDFVTQFLDEWTAMGSGLSFRSDLLELGSGTYKYWFVDRFDAQYLYELLVKDKRYKKYQGISIDDVDRFDRFNESEDSSNLVGKERTDVFRDIIAQQFICLYETSLQNGQEHTQE